MIKIYVHGLGTEPSIVDDSADCGYAAAEVAAAKQGQPWKMAAAVATDTLGYLRDRFNDIAGLRWARMILEGTAFSCQDGGSFDQS